jgi:adenylylsulfate kinase
MESHKRTFLKTISWRIIATLTTMVLVFIFTRKLSLMLGVGALDVILKMMFYYLHERAWNKIKYGRKK